MNTKLEYKDDLLREHFNPGMIEAAPVGFTQKVMTRVSLEAKPVTARDKLISGTFVPLISLTTTLILAALALLLPGNGTDPAAMPWMKIVKNLNLPAVHINLDTLFSFSLPAYLPYLFICILFLTLFDRGLSGLFHRGK
jgi:hypothetical protein